MQKIEIPSYTLGEELMNSISHGLGAAFGIVATVLMMIKCIPEGTMQTVCTAVFGVSMIVLYTMSCLYHSLKVGNAKRVLRIVDHCTIFLLIAGTYTPFTLLAIGGTSGTVLFAIVWTAALAGIIFNAVDLHKFRYLSMAAYIITGWVIIWDWQAIITNLDIRGAWLLLAGGIAYTVGAVLYGIGKKCRYMHSVFHIFVLAGSVLHFLSVYLFVV